MTYSGRNKFE
ncbi:F-box/LRR-repeat protein 20 isoform 1, partial [Danaus plexippus plexippus]